MKTRTCDWTPNVMVRAIQLALLGLCATPALVAAQTADGQRRPVSVSEWAAALVAAERAIGQTAGNASGEAPVQATPEQVAANEKAASEPEVKKLICPTSFVDLGAMNVPKNSPKFGEYNGLNSSGIYGLANFNVAGGGCQQASTLRWDVYGTNLGTTSRDGGLDVVQQGKWFVGLNLDQLRHYTTTGFQTPFQGIGSNLLTLPPDFGVISLINKSPGGGARGLTPGQLAAFRPFDVYNQRQNTTFSAGYAINPDWNFKFDYKRINMSGGKLISSGSDSMDTANPASLGGLTYSGQGIAMLINPTKSSTDSFNAAFNWAGEKSYASFEYYGSLYHDDYNGLSWTNPYVTGGTATAPNPATGTPPPNGAYMLNTMSAPPSNQFHQFNFTGGYFLSDKTRLSGGLSFGINTQNSSFDGTYTPSAVTGLPENSLGGRVLTKHADVGLTHQFTPKLNLNVGMKYNERDNNTASNTYQFYTLGGVLVTPVNAPMSNRREQADATLNYRLSERQRLTLGYNLDHIDRWCNNALANDAQGLGPASYYTDASCAQVPHSTDHSLNLGYALAAFDSVNFKAGYTYADRGATINSAFYNPMQSASTQGYENYGWLAYFQAPRREHKLKAGVNWQVSDDFSLSLDGYYTRDDYYASALGVQNGSSSNVNLEADYTLSGNASVGAYLSWQRMTLNELSAADRNPTAPPVQLWTNGEVDRDISVGFYGKQTLLHGKLLLSEDLSYNLGRTGYNTALLNVTPAAGNSGQVPSITSKMIQLRLAGTYPIDKQSRLTFGYMYQRLLSNDYMYNAFLYGYNPVQMLPNYTQSPYYSMNTVYVIYRRTF